MQEQNFIRYNIVLYLIIVLLLGIVFFISDCLFNVAETAMCTCSTIILVHLILLYFSIQYSSKYYIIFHFSSFVYMFDFLLLPFLNNPVTELHPRKGLGCQFGNSKIARSKLILNKALVKTNLIH